MRVMQRVTGLLLLASFGVCAADTVSPELILVQRVRYHMGRMLTSLPNYTCLQTIERSERVSPRKKPTINDVVRIEVALLDGKELFSWPGTGRFVDTEISQMVKGGAIGTGSFGLHARAVFMGASAKYKYEGTETYKGRNAHKWTFIVPQERSGYHVRDGINEAVVGYSGTFWVDVATLDALRLEVHADDIPSYMRLASTNDAVEYQRVRIGSEDFLLPAKSELNMSDRSGNDNTNRTTFSQCRQYSGESRLIVDEDEVTAEAAAEPRQPERVMDAPPGLMLELALESEIKFRDAAVGDPITAILQRPVKMGSGVVIAKGAVVHGRVTHIRRGMAGGRFPTIATGVLLTEMEAPGWRIRLSAKLQSLTTASPDYLNSRLSGVTDSDSETITGSLIFVKEGTMQLRRGLRMNWMTRPVRNEDQQ